MLLFFTIASVAFLFILVTSAFGHAHGGGHDFSHGADHDGPSGIAAILNVKVVAMFLMGFGGAGGVSRFYGESYYFACFDGVVAGAILGYGMFCVLEFFERQQGNSLIQTRSLIGCHGTVEVAIKGNQPGEIAVTAGERYGTYLARGQAGAVLEKGSTVRVVDSVGSDLIVERA